MELSIGAIVSLLLIIGSIQVKDVQSAKILSVAFMGSKSHKITYEPLLRELARRGHEVTILSPIDSKNETNFKNIKLIDSEAFFSQGNMFEMKLQMPAIVEAIFNPFQFITPMMVDLCTESYKLPAVHQVLEEKWDLMFFTPLFNDCLWGLVYKLNTTTIIYQQTAVFPWVADKFGSPSPPSFVSSLLIGYSDRMSFKERIWNFIRSVYDWAVLEWYYLPAMERVYREAFKDPTLPSVEYIMKNASIVLANSHISFAKPRPAMPDIIEVGGLHLVPPKPVEPKELEDFLSGAKDGFILFSMGSALKGSQMPENYRKIFLNVFSKLKQRVIWKWETEKMDDLPSNVRLSKWLPQQDVLGHKNIRLFITHGGMGSTAEAIYHGVPLVGIPMMGDQPSNVKKATDYGFAVPLDFNTLTEELLFNAVNKALNEPSYRENAQRLSRIFLDQPTKPMDRAVYWVEYVLRHKGATHLRSAARDLGYITYFSLDVLAVLLFIALVALKINLIVVKGLYRKVFGKKIADATKKKQ